MLFRLGSIRLLVAAAVACCLAGCGGSNKPPLTRLLLLFDVSGSTSGPRIRGHFRKELTDKVIPTLQPDMELVAGLITGNTLRDADLRVRVLVPAGSWTDSPRRTKREMRNMREKAVQGCTEIIAKGYSDASDLMNAFRFAETVLKGESKAKISILVVFSDMVEQTSRYDFLKERLTQERIQEIIETERKAGRLPDLKGIDVWVTGLGCSLKADSLNKEEEVKAFWLAYFHACGARTSKHRLGASLINFGISTAGKGND